MKPTVYDSGDPNLPNLPDTDQILWSDYDDYLSNNSSDDEDELDYKNLENHEKNKQNLIKRKKSNISSIPILSRKTTIASRRSSSGKSTSNKPKIEIDNNNNDNNNQHSHHLTDQSDITNENINSDKSSDNNLYLEKDEEDHLDNNNKQSTNTSKRGRRGSIFNILHIPHITRSNSFRKKSGSSIERPIDILKSIKNESISPFSSSYKLKTMQPTNSHIMAAGGSGHRRSFSTSPPRSLYDEEVGYVHEDDYTDRDVSYEDHQVCEDDDDLDGAELSDNENESDNDEIGDDNDDDDNDANYDDNREEEYLEEKRDTQPAHFKQNSFNESKQKHEPYEKGSHNINHAYKVESYNPHNEYDDEKRLDRLDTVKSSESEAISNHVAIDKKVRKIMSTDTDYESDYHLPENNSYFPESILKNDKLQQLEFKEKEKEKAKSENNNINGNGDNSDKVQKIEFFDEKSNGDVNIDNDSDALPIFESKHPPMKKSRKRRKKKRKSRKYAGSQSKKERTAWEPGIDLRTTNVFLNSPGSIITVTDYSKTRYRISHYDLYSENNPKYSKFSSDDTILSGHDFNEEYENNTPEFNEFMEYMNKVSDSLYEVENAINNKPNWSKVRWINVNGLSWEAISIIGKKYNLHPLSVEDLVDIPQRTKMDVYQQHLFIVMPLLKLLKVKRYTGDFEESYFEKVRKRIRSFMRYDPTFEKNILPHELSRSTTVLSQKSNGGASISRSKNFTKTISTKEQLNKEFTRNDTRSNNLPASSNSNNNFIGTNTTVNDRILPRSQRILKPTIEFENAEEHRLALEIERASTKRRLTDLTFITPTSSKYQSRMSAINKIRPLMSKSLAVGIEQVSMYLTSDGTVISFFEHSAMEIERAILSRLSSEYTILRETCNASILFHSVLDANTDLLYPIITAYTRILNEKEVEILTATLPDLQHTQELHLMLNELSILKNSILPLSSLITQLKDLSINTNSSFIDESCKLYLADISDHLLAFIDEIDSMNSTIENLINLIFNTLSVETNTSMQQLSLVTVLFLPLTFWAGYFGMNFKSFGVLDFDVSFFWKLAVPFTACMMILVMRKSIWRMLLKINQLFMLLIFYFKQFYNRHEINEINKRRKLRKKLNAENWDKFKLKSHKRE
jgi:Mg2+ and Co2+ transporter CorA